MSRMRHSQPLQLLGLLSSILLVLAGCGGNSGSSGGSGSTTRGRHITLQLSRSAEVVRTARNQGIASAQVRDVQPGDAGFIQRLNIRLQTPQGADLLPPQAFLLGPADQETVALDVIIPDPPPAQFQVRVSAFNNFNNQQTEIFLGQTLIQRGQDSATLTLVRNPDPATLIPVPATPASLQQTVFTFTDGAVFGLAGAPVTLAAGSFEGNTGDFALVSGGFMASGQVIIGSCNFVVTVSAFPSGQGPQVGDRITFDPCQVDAVDGRLITTNASLTPIISATSETPIPAAPTDVLVLPSPAPTLVTDEDTAGTVHIGAALAGSRPGGLTFAITGLPAHGTSGVDTTGLVTYQPGADFHGSDRLVVTVIATFTDGNAPPVVLGTVPIAITVRPLNTPPRITNLGPQTTPEGQPVSLQIVASDPDGDALTYSATGLPPGLSINATTGLISGTIPFTAVVGSLSHIFPVTVTVSDGSASASTSFTWTVINVNQPPVITSCAPARTIFEFDMTALTVSATDPDNDALTFAWKQLTPSTPMGLFTAPNAAMTTWTAPQVTTDTAFTLQVTVQDPQGAATSCQVVVTVRSTSLFRLDTSHLDGDTQRLQ